MWEQLRSKHDRDERESRYGSVKMNDVMTDSKTKLKDKLWGIGFKRSVPYSFK